MSSSSSEPISQEQPRISSVSPGEVIGERYRVEGPIGEGGMGIVCRATHVGLETPVAIKLIRPDFKDDVDFVRRFLNEARRAAALKSDRIARVHDVGQLDSGEPYLVMELLEGIELERYLMQHGPLAAIDAVNVALQLCEGLAEAHAAGIVHRDIKPSNAFLVRRADGRFAVKILDFGISKQLIEGSTSITNKDQSLGSPQYMSPEQMLDPSSVDHRSDIWSVGVVLYELLVGKRPFDGATVPEVCAKVLTAPFTPPHVEVPHIDRELEAIVIRCLDKDPNGRFADVSDLGHTLQRWACIHAHEAHVVETTAFFDSFPPPAHADDLGSLAPVADTDALEEDRIEHPRRGRRAQFFGWAALAASVALAGFAFGRSTLAVGGAPLATQLRMPWDPLLFSGPAPAPLERGNQAYSLQVAADTARAEREKGDEVAIPETDDAGDENAPAAASGSAPPAADSAPTPASAPSASLAPRPSTGSANDTPRYASSAPDTRRRLEHYKRWLAEQALMRLDSAGEQPSFMQPEPGEEK